MMGGVCSGLWKLTNESRLGILARVSKKWALKQSSQTRAITVLGFSDAIMVAKEINDNILLYIIINNI